MVREEGEREKIGKWGSDSLRANWINRANHHQRRPCTSTQSGSGILFFLDSLVRIFIVDDGISRVSLYPTLFFFSLVNRFINRWLLRHGQCVSQFLFKRSSFLFYYYYFFFFFLYLSSSTSFIRLIQSRFFCWIFTTTFHHLYSIKRALIESRGSLNWRL
jgi:hypothetical protein